MDKLLKIGGLICLTYCQGGFADPCTGRLLLHPLSMAGRPPANVAQKDPNPFAGKNLDSLEPVAQILAKNWGKPPPDLSEAVRFWCRSLSHPMNPLTNRLLEQADKYHMTLTIGPGVEIAHFDARANTVRVNPVGVINRYRALKKEITPAKIIDGIIGHEIVHGVIFATNPNYDFQRDKPIQRAAFEKPLLDIINALPRGTPGSTVANIIDTIRNTEPINRPEELVTYAVTNLQFRIFVERNGQMEKLRDHLRRFKLGFLFG